MLRLTRAMSRLAIAQVSGRRVGVVLLYHRIAEVSEGRRDGVVPIVAVNDFRRQIQFLRRYLRPVAAEEIQSAVRARRRFERFPFAITFDDDVEEHVTIAAPVLRELAVPATFFMCGASLDAPSPFWWERLQIAWDRGLLIDTRLPGDLGPVADDTVLGVAHRVSRAAPWIHRAMSVRLKADLDGVPQPSGVQAERMRELAQSFVIGFHTREHDCLQALDIGELQDAMVDGRGELEEAIGHPARSFAYPHGAAASREFEAARRAGYAVGFTTSGEVVSPDDDPLALGRIEPGVASLSEFAWSVVAAIGRARSV